MFRLRHGSMRRIYDPAKELCWSFVEKIRIEKVLNTLLGREIDQIVDS